MRTLNRQDIRNWTLTGLTLLTPMVVYAASQQGANGLYIFAPNTKIVSAEVNENFVQLDDRIGVYEDAIAVGNGLVGIGTKNPSAMLTVQGSYAYPQAIFGYDASNGNGLRIRADGGNTHYNWQIDQQGVSEGLSFVPSTTPNGSTFSTAAMTLRNSGNVGIGTNEPSEKLEVYGTLQSRIDNDYAFSIREKTGDNFRGGIGLENDGNAFMDLWRDDGTITHISSYEPSYFMGGNVGIGTESPGNLLHLKGAGSIARIRFEDTSYGKSWSIGSDGPSNFAIADATANAVRLTIDTSGNVGIGLTSPAYPLDVNGQIRAANVSVTSDARLKRDIRPLTHALEGIQCLQGVSYYLRDPEADQGLQLGLIAQEVERCYPELVSTDPEGFKSVSYDRLVAPLIEAVKTQQQLMERQQQTLQAQQQTLQTQQQHTLQAQQQALQTQQQVSARLEARLARIERTLGERP